MQQEPTDYVIEVHSTWEEVSEPEWDALWAQQALPTPFMRHAYLASLQASGSATAETGWDLRVLCLRHQGQLLAACPLYLKTHSYGEYVFDWAWADAYQRHRLAYYPKAVIAVPFTPVPGTRLMAKTQTAREALLSAAVDFCQGQGLSSLHLLFGAPEDLQASQSLGLLQRQTVQFHWQHPGVSDFESFLKTLNQEKRKKIRQERRRVSDAGVQFRHAHGQAIPPEDWDFFYRCYERTYLEHGNAPYLSRDFFVRMAEHMPEHWLLFIAERAGQPMACSLIGLQGLGTYDAVAYGRYWGALERVDCLHFEACYYQPIEWCLAHGVQRFEGGAQGEHKMARALLPVETASAHWLAHPGFAEAVANFLEREGQGVSNYLAHLESRSPLRRP